ncbi:MAG TPA: toprim domain-containing protein [Bacillota bacterium]|nr:toprim domain-containing protein [Bacillota bacterium]
MEIDQPRKVVIVEGKTDKQQIEKIIAEPLTIICTHGTLGIEEFDELLETYDLDHQDVYICVDEDEPGLELRKQLTGELPHAKHIRVPSECKEVATTPLDVLAMSFKRQGIIVNLRFLV